MFLPVAYTTLLEISCRGSFYLGSSYSTAYTYTSMCDRNKLFAVLKYKVNCLLGTCYLKYKYFYEDYQMKLLNINDFVRCSCT